MELYFCIQIFEDLQDDDDDDVDDVKYLGLDLFSMYLLSVLPSFGHVQVASMLMQH